MLNFLFKIFDSSKQNSIAVQILTDVHQQSQEGILNGCNGISMKARVENYKKIINTLKNAIYSIINHDKFDKLDINKKNNIKKIIAMNLYQESKKHESQFYISCCVDDGWGSHYSQKFYEAQGLSYSRVEEDPYKYGDNMYEICEINFPMTLFENTVLLKQLIYNSLENSYEDIFNADVIGKIGEELQTMKLV